MQSPCKPGDRIALNVPAKINLFLHVTGRRPDGYHLLESIFCPINLFDQLHLQLSEQPGVRRAGGVPGLPPQEDLVVRAAQAILMQTGCDLGVEIDLIKRIPTGAGLGGGSADAAFTLMGLNHLLGQPLQNDQLHAIALQLGADVPFFLLGQPAFVSGIGEQLDPLQLPALPIVILKPPAHIPTAQIFSSPDLTRNGSSVKITVFGFYDVESIDSVAANSLLQFVATQTSNHLQPCAEQVANQVTEALSAFEQLPTAAKPLWFRMTGSGSAVFGVFGSTDTARQAAQHLFNWVANGKPADHSSDAQPWFIWCGSTLTTARLEDQRVTNVS